MIEEGVFKWIQTNTALQAVLPPTNSIFMGFVPESAKMPCIMFSKVSSVYDTTFDGPSTYTIRRYQFNCYGQDTSNTPGSGYISAQIVADTLRKQLNGAFGTLPDGTLLFNAILDNELDIYSDDQTYVAIQDYFLHFQQT